MPPQTAYRPPLQHISPTPLLLRLPPAIRLPPPQKHHRLLPSHSLCPCLQYILNTAIALRGRGHDILVKIAQGVRDTDRNEISALNARKSLNATLQQGKTMNLCGLERPTTDGAGVGL